MTPNISPEWRQLLADEFEQPYMQQLRQFLVADRAAGNQHFPPASLVFNAFNHCPPKQVKVVVLGQDPYHGEGQAHGLSFSVPAGIKPPPSLMNIYKELHADVAMEIPQQGDLSSWAEQGVMLLNSVLTVTAGEAASHQKQGWESFTDTVIDIINSHCDHVVFLLWGSYAQKKAAFVDADKHCVLKAPHPSPLSAHRGFLGCKHFSQTNTWLSEKGLTPIRWESVLAAS